MSRSLRFLAVVVIGGIFLVPRLLAHDLPRSSVLAAFAKVENHEIHFLVRVPLDLMRDARFPANGNLVDLVAVAPATERALAVLAASIRFWEKDTLLTPSKKRARLALPSDRSFEDYDTAVAHVAAPVASDTEIYADQGYLDAHITYPTSSAEPLLEIQTALAPERGDYIELQIEYLPLHGVTRSFTLTSRSGRVAFNPAPFQVARRLARRGFAHSLTSVDHVFLLLCLIIPCRRLREAVPVIIAFALSHSLALVGNAYDSAQVGPWFVPFVQTAVAASVVYVSLENVVRVNLGRRWLVAAGTGLVYGLASSHVLRPELQFAASHSLVARLSFNLGIAGGHFTVLTGLVAATSVLTRDSAAARAGVVLLSAIVAHSGWHWMIGTGGVLWQIERPVLDTRLLETLVRWVAGVFVAIGAAKLVAEWVEHTWPTQIVPVQQTSSVPSPPG